MTVDISVLLEGDDALSSLPEVFYRLRETVESPDSTFEEIGELIALDPGLSARLLRIVNSAFYGFPSRIDSIPHAASIIGTNQLLDLVLSTAVIRLFRNIPGKTISMRTFWEHSLSCGLAARIIANLKQESNPEGLFTAGLLHDLGILVLCKKIPSLEKQALDLSRTNRCGLYEAERQVMGFDHAIIGAGLLKLWKLPGNLVEIVQYHHGNLPIHRQLPALRIVQAADALAHCSEIDFGGDDPDLALKTISWEQIGLSEKTHLPVITQRLDEMMAEVQESFLAEV